MNNFAGRRGISICGRTRGRAQSGDFIARESTKTETHKQSNPNLHLFPHHLHCKVLPSVEMPSENQGPVVRGGRGSNAQRSGTNTAKAKAPGKPQGGRQSKEAELEAQLAQVKGRGPCSSDFRSFLTFLTRPGHVAQLAAAQATAARGATQAVHTPVQRLFRPKGEAGDRKNGFILQDAMGLEDDREKYEALLVSASCYLSLLEKS